MFGRMSAMPFVRLDAGKELEVAVAELLAATDHPEIARWIQFPRGLMLFLLVPGDSESGAVYVSCLSFPRRFGGGRRVEPHEDFAPLGVRRDGAHGVSRGLFLTCVS
jgi:hypothetical protein